VSDDYDAPPVGRAQAPLRSAQTRYAIQKRVGFEGRGNVFADLGDEIQFSPFTSWKKAAGSRHIEVRG
jgi:hypothetical protein